MLWGKNDIKLVKTLNLKNQRTFRLSSKSLILLMFLTALKTVSPAI